MFIRKIKQRLCKHDWRPITIERVNPYNRDGVIVKAFTKCNRCDSGRVREHFVSRKSMLRRSTYVMKEDSDRFCWAIAGALAREVYGKKLTNFQLGWID